ncbi:response regulator [Aggregicoccus sp. 17bor-14]|uniref:response regulator n=1 Tax=Myxococcaceae TaxID=31 RepID=UPI00129C5E38|nr:MULTISPECIES: response regulator [Myxococcaceae]MBF5042113.1 response regulator [Simulacricoccus sp. 17bor-14]MRI87890.1 response regulator [Aggregicoccus sp. 17bor-14]
MATSQTQKPEGLAAGRPTPLPRLLIVEDSLTMRETLRILLSQDFDCEVAEDGARGLVLALASPPDLLLSDVEMRGVDGYELVRRVRAQPTLAHCRIVLLSGHAPRTEEHGADLYLVKPVRPALLIERLHGLLRARLSAP